MNNNNLLKSNLDNLKKNIKKLNQDSKQEKSENNNISGLKYVTSITIEITAGLAVGSLIGYQIDKFFETKPLFFIIFMILGLAGGFVNMIRSLK